MQDLAASAHREVDRRAALYRGDRSLPELTGRDVVLVSGTHSLRADREIEAVVAEWLAGDFSLS